MARTNTAVSVGTTATPLAAARTGRTKIAFANNGGTTLYVGDANVTTATGLPVAAGQTLFWESIYSVFESVVTDQDAWYGVVASGTCDVRVLEG
jgi:hypothetical protein